MTSHQLSEGVINSILAGEKVASPVVQILGYKKVPGDEDDRYRLLISDGKWCYPTAMLGTELASLVSSGNLQKFAVVRVNNYECTTLIPEKKIIIFLDLEVISPGSDIGQCIGHPVPVENSNVLPSPSDDSSLTSPTKSSEESTSTRITRLSLRPRPPPAPVIPTRKRREPGSAPRPKKVKTEATSPRLTPISKLHPYRKKWTIRARVTHKTPVREFCNPRREGKLFTFDLIDEKRYQIRAAVFNKWVDKYFDMIEINKVYYISNARMKVARQRYTSLKHYYEINFTANTVVAPCEGNFDNIPSLQFDFIPLDEMDDLDPDTALDIIGVCCSFQEVENALAKGTIEMPKRDIILIDQSNAEISVSLWGDLAENFDGSSYPVVAFKGARLNDLRVITTFVSTAMYIDPDIEEARVLRKWFDKKVGRGTESKPAPRPSSSGFLATNWKILAQAKKETQNKVGEPQYYKAKATVIATKKENCLYMACLSNACSRNVNSLPNGKYVCTGCRREYDSFKWRLNLTVSFADFSDDQWATCFGDTAESLLNKNAQELRVLKESSGGAFNEIFAKISFESYIIELCATKMEVANAENQFKTTVLSVNPVSPADFSRKLLNDIKQMEKIL